MFITYKPAEIFLGAYLGDDSTQYWQYVEQTTHCPWFYVRVGRQQGSEALTSMVMLPCISALEQLLTEQGADIWLLDVQLISPAYLNGSDGWKMERLLELRETMDDMSAGAAYVYSLEGGHIYTEDLGSGRSNLQRPRIIFSAASAYR
ncbi:hypothetical protein C1X59_05860 [Pseudomonas sp. FW215-R2]|uniref:hypothetical protein n=1 Tax=unclassified Pseudomonas TaxID=196821 RepID=UPI000C887EB9|nr:MULTISPECIES: hypothetical protein [unclassified Pseudomonas]PMX03144.1 hypothetical protein C1X59_05860 [Pseudomonas sp. FW215-R2]PMX11890.1 hypothetical protein C1X60_04800 [Pseudomonas sp. FW215-L1]PMX25560.1 hypothetical protein C1X57_03540 [Pseudomonas sp. FW215-E1]PNA32562.1 hypothetical protein C1X58_03020 [Pseudomonas sp. FW215-R4]